MIMTSLVDLRALCLLCTSEGWDSRKISKGWGAHPQLLLRQVTATVDATIHGHKALEGRSVPHVGVVEASVEHDDREGQHVAGVCGTWHWSQFWLRLLSHPLSQSRQGPARPWLSLAAIQGPASSPTLANLSCCSAPCGSACPPSLSDPACHQPQPFQARLLCSLPPGNWSSL